mgnify:CR=1 FL=1
MLAYRIIARLDIKGENLIKGIQFEGLRVLGRPADFAKRYADEGADELLYIDTVASLYGRNQLESLIEETSAEVFIPINIGGGIRSCEGVRTFLKAGADRVSINTGAMGNPDLIGNIKDCCGAQAICVSIEAKKINGGWEAYTHCGRNPSGKDAIKWAQEAVALGAGEILVTSIDCDGTRRGPDIELLKSIEVDVPVIYSGGIRLQDVCEVAEYSDGMAIGASLHYGDCTIQQVKDALRPHKEIR